VYLLELMCFLNLNVFFFVWGTVIFDIGICFLAAVLGKCVFCWNGCVFLKLNVFLLFGAL